MAKNRKKKKPAISNPTSLSRNISHTRLEKSYSVACKILRMHGFDRNILDCFTKRQHLSMFAIIMEKPRVRVKAGHKVPKAHVKFVHQLILEHINSQAIECEDIILPYMDFFTYGVIFWLQINALHKKLDTLSEKQQEVVTQIMASFNEEAVFPREIGSIVFYLRLIALHISKITFRRYGLHWEFESIQGGVNMGIVITANAHDAEKIYFEHKNKRRLAYRLGEGECGDPESWTTIPFKLIYPEINSDKNLNIYIQSHAFNRMQERLDNLEAPDRNMVLMTSLIMQQEVKQTPDKNRLITCRGFGGTLVGYFPFIIQDDNLFILTFLPLASPQTPEGKFFTNKLNLNVKDMDYLGMDKLSFYTSIDFEQIPVLKDALIESEIWQLTEMQKREKPDYELKIDEKRTAFIAKFFSEREENTFSTPELLD